MRYFRSRNALTIGRSTWILSSLWGVISLRDGRCHPSFGTAISVRTFWIEAAEDIERPVYRHWPCLLIALLTIRDKIEMREQLRNDPAVHGVKMETLNIAIPKLEAELRRRGGRCGIWNFARVFVPEISEVPFSVRKLRNDHRRQRRDDGAESNVILQDQYALTIGRMGQPQTFPV